MQYAVTKLDGSVAIVTLFPSHATHKDGTEYVVLGQRAPGVLQLQNPASGEVIEQLFSGPSENLTEDSLPDFALGFSDIAEFMRRSNLVGTARQLAPGDVPADRTFREALKDDGKVLDHDMEKAKAIQRDRIRAARQPLLDALDVEYQRADEKGDAAGKKAVTARKQALRDAPADPAIDAATTVDELKSAWPAALG